MSGKLKMRVRRDLQRGFRPETTYIVNQVEIVLDKEFIEGMKKVLEGNPDVEEIDMVFEQFYYCEEKNRFNSTAYDPYKMYTTWSIHIPETVPLPTTAASGGDFIPKWQEEREKEKREESRIETTNRATTSPKSKPTAIIKSIFDDSPKIKYTPKQIEAILNAKYKDSFTGILSNTIHSVLRRLTIQGYIRKIGDGRIKKYQKVSALTKPKLKFIDIKEA